VDCTEEGAEQAMTDSEVFALKRALDDTYFVDGFTKFLSEQAAYEVKECADHARRGLARSALAFAIQARTYEQLMPKLKEFVKRQLGH
jgi:hypothetical protein